MKCHASGGRGFTLVELMATLAVLAISLGLAVPAFTGLQRRVRAADAYSELTTSLAAARLLAVRLRQPVSICPSRDGRRCLDSVVWSDGWIIYADPDRNRQPAGPSAVLHRGEPIEAALALRSTSGRKLVRFLPTGWASGSNLSVRLCSRASGRLLGKVIVNNAGRPRTEHLEDDGTACPYAI